MLRTILVGIEPSEYSNAAYKLAVRWAKQFDALLVGIGVVDRPGICRADSMPLELQLVQSRRDASMMIHATNQVEKCLGRFAVACAEDGVACKVLEEVGQPFDQIANEAQRYDLIVLGQETHFCFETQSEADDTLNRLLKSSPRPVVVAPDMPPRTEQSGVLFCCDGSAKASRALKSYLELGFPKDLPVTVLAIDLDHLAAARHAERAVDYLSMHGIQATAMPVESRLFPSDVILQHARSLKAGLIVMGARGRSVLSEFLLGSVTRAVVREAKVPVLMDH